MDRDFQDKIDEYLLDRMSDEDRTRFEAEVDEDIQKKEQLEFTRNVKDAINSRQKKLNELEVMSMLYDRQRRNVSSYNMCEEALPSAVGADCSMPSQESGSVKKRSAKRIWLWLSGTAALLATCIFVFNVYTYNSDTQDVMRGDDNDVFNPMLPVVGDTIESDTLGGNVFVIEEKFENDEK